MTLSEVAPKVRLPKLARLATSAVYCFERQRRSLHNLSDDGPISSSQEKKQEGEPSLVGPVNWHCH
jgi:hypothetical protein